MIWLMLITKLFLILFLVAPSLHADGFDRSQATPESQSNSRIEDERLPPLLPGEIVNNGNKKIRVLTTVGPVPVATANNSWPTDGMPSGINVIVDSREVNGQQKWPHQHKGHKGIQHKQKRTKVPTEQSDSYINSEDVSGITE